MSDPRFDISRMNLRFWLVRPVRKVSELMFVSMLNTMIRGRNLVGSDTSTFDEISDAVIESLTMLESAALDTMTRTSPLVAVRIAVTPIPSDTGSKAFLISS